MKDLAAGGQDVQARSRGQQVADDRRAGHEMLEVVENEQRLPVAQEVDQRVGERPITGVKDPQDLRDRPGDEARIGDGRKRDEGRTVVEPIDHVPGHPDGEAGLPRAPRAGEGQEARFADQPFDGGHIRGAPDEAGELVRDVCPPRAQ
jgi:hypothetical protein